MKGEFPTKVTDFIPLKYFCAYFQKIVFRLNKILGVDGSMDASPALYVIAQRGDLGNFKFLHYSLLMHLILFYNVGHVDSSFVEALDNFREALPVQRWTRLW